MNQKKAYSMFKRRYLILGKLILSYTILSCLMFACSCARVKPELLKDSLEPDYQIDNFIEQGDNQFEPSEKSEQSDDRSGQSEKYEQSVNEPDILLVLQHSNCSRSTQETEDVELPANSETNEKAIKLKSFIAHYCLSSVKLPLLLMKELEHLKQDNQWSSTTLAYLNFFSWHLREFSRINGETEKMRIDVQKILSALAEVELLQLNKNWEPENAQPALTGQKED